MAIVKFSESLDKVPRKMAGSRSRPPPARNREQSMEKDAGWCCIAKPRAISPPAHHRKAKSGELLQEAAEEQRLDADDKKQAGDGKKESHERRAFSEDLLKSGAISSVLKKQGYVGSVVVEKTGGSGSPFRLRLSPGKVSPLVEQTSALAYASQTNLSAEIPTSVACALPLEKTASLVQLAEKNKNSSTLFDMMVQEHQVQAKPVQVHTFSSALITRHQSSIQERMHIILTQTSPGSLFNDISSSDVKLTLSSKEGCCVTVNVHKQTLSSQSRFFAAKLSDRWSKQRVPPYMIDVSDCDDVEVYLQTIRLMYCRDLKRALMKENVAKVLGILKVSASIVFEAGIMSCLEYLEAVPWSEDEEEKVMSLVSQLHLDGPGASEVLTRLSITDGNASQDILSGLLDSVTKGTDDKARREMKALVARMLQENAAQECSQRTLYHACHVCLDLLMQLFKQAANADIPKKNIVEDRGVLLNQIARQADNLFWLAEMLIDQQIADDFLKLWACQTELAALHMRIPIVLRYEVSRITARLCIAIGKGQVLSPKDVRLLLLQTWFQPLIDDFGWLHRCCKGLDKNVVEEAISQTILTLPFKQQRGILLGWFDRFSTMGDDCPNLQKAFEVWWRRTFVRPCMDSSIVSSQVM
ncbi:hypothetical protein O6H91_15G081800 [Diphasiastrum complanatum]|uniref:Uncharacterized protein n=1 Tax=Diphasiastrum complanatum TaxID=34168 RepID=A0ACC2BK63_DIPCM|nr:hypothetical protein O6H91_Y119000 [Diphasiastrum complanatum]KAJ7530151.1 hypothetical protein O6H91_15G081800 [Diphasiastrum complanatum]